MQLRKFWIAAVSAATGRDVPPEPPQKVKRFWRIKSALREQDRLNRTAKVIGSRVYYEVRRDK